MQDPSVAEGDPIDLGKNILKNGFLRINSNFFKLCDITQELFNIETWDKCHFIGFLNGFLDCAIFFTSDLTLTFEIDLEICEKIKKF